MSRARPELPDINAHIFWATIDYHRMWLTVDQIEMWRLAAASRELTAQSIRRIGAAYYVNRGIRQVDGDEGARQLAEKLNSTTWPNGLVDRCESCVELAQWAATTIVGGETITRGRQVSAITKLMWFLQPTGWTLFDRFVAKAVGVSTHLPRPDQARGYYGKLQGRKFVACASQAAVKVCTSFPDFHPERVLDRYLMIKGGLYGEQLNELPLVLEGYLRGLGSDASRAVSGLAYSLQDAFGPDPMRVYEGAV